ncbi:MAG: UTRA domain-containing protein [Egibacteraceae bacterium]
MKASEPLAHGVANTIEKTGKHYTRVVEDLFSRMPTPEESAALKLNPGVPLVLIWHSVYDQAGEPLECVLQTFAGDRHTFHDEFTVERS